MMKVEATKEHRWLMKLVGEWEYGGECVMEPGSDPMKFSGTESVRAIGDLWIVGESRGEMPGGGAATMVVTLGFDPKKGRVVGTWIGSMMTHMWIYDGWLDESGKVLTLESEGACPANPDKTSKFRDITEMKSDNHRVFRAMMQQDDGTWQQLMSMELRRKK